MIFGVLFNCALDYLMLRSFSPYWQVIRTLAEKISTVHQELLTSWQELLRDVQKYNADQQKKHREVKFIISSVHLQFMSFKFLKSLSLRWIFNGCIISLYFDLIAFGLFILFDNLLNEVFLLLQIKDHETGTIESVQGFQQTLAALQKVRNLKILISF